MVSFSKVTSSINPTCSDIYIRRPGDPPITLALGEVVESIDALPEARIGRMHFHSWSVGFDGNPIGERWAVTASLEQARYLVSFYEVADQVG